MIKVVYSSFDGYVKVGRYKTVKGARKFAHHWIGEHPQLRSTYAVSDDGVGKIECSGCTVQQLFPER